MSFLSEYIGSPVVNVEGDKIGFLKDIIARDLPDLHHPMIQALVVQQGNESFDLPYSAVVAFIPKAIPLKANYQELGAFTPQERDIFLARDVLDKQIIDTEGARVVRVNDVELMRINGSLYIGNVDIGGLGLLRRLGLDRTARQVFSRLGLHLSQNCIAWDDVELLPNAQSVRLKVPVDKIAQLHPADVAEILSDLNRQEGGHFLAALDVEQVADTLEEVEPEFQASLVESMPDEKVADILEEMEPDEAADLLAELPEERSRGLLDLMQAEEAKDVRRLLTYPVESAGGIMTTWFAAVRPDLTAAQAIQALRETYDESEIILYVYVTDTADHLVGVFSLSNLIFANPEAKVSTFMQKRVVSVDLYDDQTEVAQVISKYDLMAVPVVDEQNRLQGIVTADDALDKIIPTAWKKRLPRFFR